MGRRGAWGLVLGPLAFIAAWAVAGARTPGYEPLSDAISRTAANGAPQRQLMTTGFVLYALGSAAGAVALRRAIPGPAWIASAVNGAATLGVALTPLEHSSALDTAHTVTATTGYVSLALTPLLAARPLADAGYRRAAVASGVTGAVVAACLAATAVTEDSGLPQRLGLTTGDVWLIATGAAILTGWTATRPAA
ncbi:MAG TPA: DUF998 domain-containing protein [Iamia sp.]|nr:DUF998 domain-containing protein [Iamia sp.]